jgi:hypothetical protein
MGWWLREGGFYDLSRDRRLCGADMKDKLRVSDFGVSRTDRCSNPWADPVDSGI